MHSESSQLRVHVEVQKAAVRRRRNIVFQLTAAGFRNITIGAVIVSFSFDIRRIRNVEDVDLAVDGKRAVLAMASAGVPRQDEKLAIL